ncbi:MAG: hypothetical protein OHK0046_46330 [Anaerolineae bacterium]
MTRASWHCPACGEVGLNEMKRRVRVRLDGTRVTETVMVRCLRCGREEAKSYSFSRPVYRLNGQVKS